MKIGIHALWADSDSLGGLATYLATLVANLGHVDRSNSYVVYYADSRTARNDYVPPHFRTRVLWPPSSWIGIPISLPLELLSRPVDLLHVIAVAPPVCPVPFVQTIHDVDYELNPGFYPWSIRVRLSRLVPSTSRRARKILTTSEFSKKCITKFYGIPEEKIVVTYHGVHPKYRRVEDPDALRRLRSDYSIPDRFILYVGKIQARKNISRLLRAFHILKREWLFPHTLVLVGRRTWSSSEIMETLKELNLAEDVLFLGEKPIEELLLFYTAAELFVFPSLSEGFGIPPLEAMACGTPVVASNATSIPEVVGDAALLVNPFDVKELAQGMRDALTQDQLRSELISRGLKRVTMFSNRQLAEKTLEVYNEVGKR